MSGAPRCGLVWSIRLFPIVNLVNLVNLVRRHTLLCHSTNVLGAVTGVSVRNG